MSVARDSMMSLLSKAPDAESLRAALVTIKAHRALLSIAADAHEEPPRDGPEVVSYAIQAIERVIEELR